MKIQVRLAPPEMTAYKRSLNHALSTRPVTDSLNMTYMFPTASSMLEAIDMLIATLDPYHPFAQARRDVIQYQRSHGDMEGFKAVLGVDDTWVDNLFLDAMKFEGTL